MKKLNIFMPQWQGSGISKEIYEGSHALKNFIEEQGLCTFKNILVESDSIPIIKNDILGYDIISKQLKEAEMLLYDINPSKIFALGGGCGIEIPIVSYLKERHEDITLFWFDAHGDLNSPESSVSKHFHGMPLRFITDKSLKIDDLRINSVSLQKVNVLGVRDLDEPEINYIQKHDISVITVKNIKDVEAFKASINHNVGKAYIHIDLDVLDPRDYRNVKCPTDKGLKIEELMSAVEVIGHQMEVVGLSIVENTEKDTDEMMKLYDIIRFGIEI